MCTVLKLHYSTAVFKHQGTCPGPMRYSSNDVRLFWHLSFYFQWLFSQDQLPYLGKKTGIKLAGEIY